MTTKVTREDLEKMASQLSDLFKHYGATAVEIIQQARLGEDFQDSRTVLIALFKDDNNKVIQRREFPVKKEKPRI